MDNTAVLVGAGFSAEAGLPTTTDIFEDFLSFDNADVTAPEIQDEITDRLENYWSDVFGIEADQTPTFEDHFTTLDLAANAGHNLGQRYSPKRLRALRRMSIHRVFDILDQRFDRSPEIQEFLETLADGTNNTLLSTNWDVVPEKHLSRADKDYWYGIETFRIGTQERMARRGLEVLKLHGSSNWAYCDSCRRVFAGPPTGGKTALRKKIYLAESDFRLTTSGEEAADILNVEATPQCHFCGTRLSGRIATFSYAKALGFFQFQGIWERALRQLGSAQHWIFIGYSFPPADFELRHLLKTAELADSRNEGIEISVVLRDDCEARERYLRFFDIDSDNMSLAGFKSWYDQNYG